MEHEINKKWKIVFRELATVAWFGWILAEVIEVNDFGDKTGKIIKSVL